MSDERDRAGGRANGERDRAGERANGERDRAGGRSLSEAELEALAHGRRDLAGERARVAAEDPRLAAWITREREGSREASVALKRAAPELDDLDAMIAAAMAKAPVSIPDAPSRASLAIGAIAGGIVAIGAGAVSMIAGGPLAVVSETWGDLSTGARTAVTLGTAIDRLAQLVPGGWATLAVIGLAIVGTLMVPLRVIAGIGRRAAGAGATLALAWIVGGGSIMGGGVARAYDLEGEWPEREARASVEVDRAPRSEALRQACASAGIGLAYAMASDPEVTLHVRDVPLREVLDALLGDEAASVRHLGHVIAIRDREREERSGAHAGAGPAITIAPMPAAAVPPVPPAYERIPVPPPPPGIAIRDLVTFGGDARVRRGQQVRDVITMGGDARVEGEAFGNVVTMGGDVEVEGTVVGDVLTMGGDIRVAESGRVHGQLEAMGGDVHLARERSDSRAPAELEIASRSAIRHAATRDRGSSWVEETLDALMKHALLFLLGLMLMGLAPARMQALQRQIVTQPVRSLASGFLGLVAGAVLTVVLVITIVGIPGAIVLALGGFLGAYFGLATAASVIGAALPAPALKDHPVLQLAVGILILFLVSRIPVIGPLAAFMATMIGLGAVIVTRAGQRSAA